VSDLSVVAIAIAVLATAFGATIQGGIGFGMNLVTVPVLALLVPESVPVTPILLGFPISTSMLLHERHALDRGIAWIMAGRVPGTVLGTWIVLLVSAAVLQGIVGVVVLTLALASAAAPALPMRPDTQFLAGAVSGVTGTAAGIGGPPLALLYQHRSGDVLRSTLAAAFFFGTVLSLATLALAGEIGGSETLLGLGLAPFALAGSFAGRRFHDVLDRGWLRPAVVLFAVTAALVVIVDALV
jgi:uncharacterized membrane protein YfcA